MFGQSQSKMPSNKGDQTGQFRMRDAQRIAAAVHAHETSVRDSKESRLPRAFATGGRMFLGKTSSSWNKGTSQDIDVYDGGTPPNETKGDRVIEDAWNKFADIGSGKWVMLAPFNGRFYVIAAECD